MWKKLIFCCLFLVSIFGYFNLRSSNNKSGSELLGVYLDGVYGENIPGKSDGYVVDKVECDNDATGVWDYDKWGLLVNNMSKKSKCNVFFKKGIKLADTIISVDTSGKCPTVNDDGTVNVTGAESENSLLCMAPDDYGTSYYFRGNVSNNYVKFANFYWRIIRVNGDGSVRMIYDGTSAHKNGEASEDRTIGTSAFNDKYDDNAYVGYMYGTPFSSTYAATHANINDSTIKKYIDNWYEKSIKDSSYETYLSDNIFCNDRSFNNQYNTGNGTGTSATKYRWYIEDDINKVNLKCSNQNDAFTVTDELGNKKLKYSIALSITDEAALAGGYAMTSNNRYYLYTGFSYFNMTPIGYYDSYVRERCVMNTGAITGCAYVQLELKVKPVINLKAGSLKSGDGTMDNPYIVE